MCMILIATPSDALILLMPLAQSQGFSVIAALVITAVMQRIVYGSPLSRELWLALPTVILATWLHSAYPPKPKLESKRE